MSFKSSRCGCIRFAAAVVIVAVISIAARCADAQLVDVKLPPAPTTRPDGWLLQLPGIGGALRIDRTLIAGLIDSGLPVNQVQVYDWTGPDRGLASLGNVHRHVEQSKIVADLILSHVRSDPGQRIIITAHSAGAGVAVWALEQLPDDVQINDLVLIAPALSPGYDLSKALRHVKHAYAFTSTGDDIVLGACTRTFGTVDRVQTDAAGRVGFTMPPTADATQYAKFKQFPYDEDWIRFDDYGEHIGAMTRPFAAHVIGPVLEGKGVPPRATTQPATQPAR